MPIIFATILTSFKNIWPTGRYKIGAYVWAIIGLHMHAILKCDMQEIKGYAIGLYEYYVKGFGRT